MAGSTELTSAHRFRVYCLCACAGIVEGYDLQSGGIAAPKFALDFHLAADQVGGIFLFTSLGLALGASVGGWLGDRFGAGRMMAVAVGLFGLASLGSASVWDGASLATTRALTGMGLGGALPNMIATLNQVGPPRGAPRRVMLSITGIGIGALSAGLILLLNSSALSWRTLFRIGGWCPLLVATAIGLWMPKIATRAPEGEVRSTTPSVERLRLLFSRDFISTTIVFWLVFFVTAATSYLLINWLPTFLVHSALTQHQVGVCMIGLAIGGAAGPMCLAGILRAGRVRMVVVLAYLGIISGLLFLISGPRSIGYLFSAIAFTGFFTSGTQAILFGIVGPFYPFEARGTGVGSAVAVGRIGSGAGPALAGVMLAAGQSQQRVLAAAVPMLLLALSMLLFLLRTSREYDLQRGVD